MSIRVRVTCLKGLVPISRKKGLLLRLTTQNQIVPYFGNRFSLETFQYDGSILNRVDMKDLDKGAAYYQYCCFLFLSL